MTIELTADTFLPLISRGTCLVVWYAQACERWLAFCRVFADASRRHPETLFGQIDAERESELARRCGVDRVPTTMAFRRGGLVFARAGLCGVDSIDRLVDALRTGRTGRLAHN